MREETYDGVLQGETSYEYDELLRLISTKENRNGAEYRNITYGYDDSGNRIKEESTENGVKTTKNYTYGEGNLVKEYDLLKNGEECSDSDKPKTLNKYNALNQLVSSETSEITIINEYNAEGLRTGKEVKSEGIDTLKKTNYTYEYDQVIFETLKKVITGNPEKLIYRL